MYKDDGRDDSYGGSGSYRNSYDGYNDHNDNHGSGGNSGTGGSARESATVRLLSCATKRKPYARVEVTNSSSVDGRFVVTVTFRDARDLKIASKREEAAVPADGKTIVKVPVPRRAPIAKVDRCDLSPKAPPAQ
ncbi:hypothetical protein GCM10009549_57930 [Streptomyces thermoalcalitolerans]|uniref:Uncharacterized protein n=1 Tax=Streptomyces thermoalcalitolerans TaxID=65605 RepID=A0ABN1PWA0_9ACTN